jgi:hypothetical protein
MTADYLARAAIWAIAIVLVAIQAAGYGN